MIIIFISIIYYNEYVRYNFEVQTVSVFVTFDIYKSVAMYDAFPYKIPHS